MQLIICLLLSLTLMFCDMRGLHINYLRYGLNTFASILHFSVYYLQEEFKQIKNDLQYRKKIIAENKQLKQQLFLLQTKQLYNYSLQDENSEMRRMLHAMPQQYHKGLLAQIIQIKLDHSSQKIVLNRGSIDGVYIGQPVIDGYGIVGQVISVGIINSIVLMISDIDHAIPVENARTGFRATIAGSGKLGKLFVHNANSHEMAIGDIMLSTGLGGHFPAMYPVAKIIAMSCDKDQNLCDFTFETMAKLNNNIKLLLIWPSNNAKSKS